MVIPKQLGTQLLNLNMLPFILNKVAILFFIYTLGLTHNTTAQQPSHFVLGEDQFRGIQIYDVIQDKDLNYWFATNEGIYWFNSVNYEKIECHNAKSNSVFTFVMNEAGTIYCHNLNNQVFEIKNKICRVFYELKEDEGGSDVSLTLSKDGKILIGSKKFVVLNQAGKVLQRYPITLHYIGPSFQDSDHKIHYHLSESDTVLQFSNGKFTKQKLKGLSKTAEKPHVLKFYTLDQHSYALDLTSKKHYRYDPRTFTLSVLPSDSKFERSGSVRFYETKSGLWIAGTLPGVSYLGNKFLKTDQQVFFDSYFISDVYQDAEGNILLSTFDKGVLIIPDLKVPDVIHSFEDDPVTSLYNDPSKGLIMGSSKGLLLKYSNDQLTTLSSSGKRPIEEIESHEKGEWYIFDDGCIRAYNKKSGKKVDVVLASLKDVVFISPNEFYLGTNRGVAKVIETSPSTFQIEWLKLLNSRIHFMDFDPINQHLYVSSATGLFVLPSNGKLKSIQYKGQDLFPNGIHYSNGKVYVSTKEDGILVLQKGKITGTINPMIQGKQVILRKIIIHQNTIVAQSSEGFFQFDMKGKLIKSLHSLFGFTSKRVIDFAFQNDILWVSHSGGVQAIDLNYQIGSPLKLFVRIDKVLVNNTKAKGFNSEFGPEARKFQFFFSSPTLRNRETIIYHYRLVGNENTWYTNDYKTNQITYNALAPGKYVFELKIEQQGIFSEVQTYSFTIAQPFYSRWWFLVLAGLLFIGTVIVIYRWQLSVQRKKSERINELNASKLTAIQSQMNPHFIFNSLNSIQDLILKGDVEHSYSYITTFSNLVRRTLNYSEKDFIDFEQEIKLLELYFSLEKLRFKKDFNYTIEHTGIEDVMIPPLLIQPFIENSLVHGLLHKEGQKNLKITFELKDVLICTIEDNGIGREAARLIKQRQRAEHESFSSKAIQNRFEILSSVFEGKFGYHYEDPVEDGKVLGTKVVLHIPYRQKF